MFKFWKQKEKPKKLSPLESLIQEISDNRCTFGSYQSSYHKLFDVTLYQELGNGKRLEIKSDQMPTFSQAIRDALDKLKGL